MHATTTFPKQIGEFRVIGILGHGATGIVYQAHDPTTRSQVAIKTIPLTLHDQEAGKLLALRLRREALAAGRLSHANVTRILSFGEDQGIPFLVMELHQGVPLREIIRTPRRPGREQGVAIMLQTLAGLEHVHGHGVIHCDLKPANIILLPNDQVKITDFGAARFANEPAPATSKVTGTHGYMAPEQLMGQKIDARADLFSAGVILHELLTGNKPFQGAATQEITQNILTQPPSDPASFDASIPAPFFAVVKKALAKRPRDRFPNAALFMEALALAHQNRLAPFLTNDNDNPA
ncbi:MAG: serine/threonine protein kinase [Magnetococcales bacterium]|nr:serine/threonine protein kinase [Magnetococcales bacterium]